MIYNKTRLVHFPLSLSSYIVSCKLLIYAKTHNLFFQVNENVDFARFLNLLNICYIDFGPCEELEELNLVWVLQSYCNVSCLVATLNDAKVD